MHECPQQVSGFVPLAFFWVLAAVAAACLQVLPAFGAGGSWTIGTPIVTYWAGPKLTDAVAEQMVAGGYNLVWCGEKGLEVAQRHGLRAQLQDGLLTPASLNDPARRAKLDALIDRVKGAPALYSYFLRDEPSAPDFAGLGKLVAYLRERDPAHLAYINLLPTYASNAQLGTKGSVIDAYREYLNKFVDVVKPGLISYDHYSFQAGGKDGGEYFLNLSLIRQCALDNGLPFLNIVQASSWSPSMRVPNGDEDRWLAYTSLAYGAKGISYFVYSIKGVRGGLADVKTGAPTDLYYALRRVNREFVAIAKQLQPLRSLGMYFLGMVPPGGAPLPADAPFKLEPTIAAKPYAPPAPIQGMLIGVFGPREGHPTDALVVNLNYKTEEVTTVVGKGPLEVYDPVANWWRDANGPRARIRLRPGGGRLVRLKGED